MMVMKVKVKVPVGGMIIIPVMMTMQASSVLHRFRRNFCKCCREKEWNNCGRRLCREIRACRLNSWTCVEGPLVEIIGRKRRRGWLLLSDERVVKDSSSNYTYIDLYDYRCMVEFRPRSSYR